MTKILSQEEREAQDAITIAAVKKVRKLHPLIESRIVTESVPDPRYWNFAVLKPDALPPKFREEFQAQGYLRVDWGSDV